MIHLWFFVIFCLGLESPRWFSRKMSNVLSAGMVLRRWRDMVHSRAACSSCGDWFVVLPWCPGHVGLSAAGLCGSGFQGPHPLRCPSIEASWYGPMAGKGPNALKLEALQADDLSRPLVLCIRFCVADDPEVSSWERILSRFLFLLGKKICTFDLCRYWVGFLHWPQQDWYVKLFGTDSESPESESNDASDETGDTSSEDREKSLFQCLPDHWVKFVTPMVCSIMLNPKKSLIGGTQALLDIRPLFWQVPTLVIHGQKDRLIDSSQGGRFAASSTDCGHVRLIKMLAMHGQYSQLQSSYIVVS